MRTILVAVAVALLCQIGAAAPASGRFCVVAVDDETEKLLTANFAVFGVYDTTAITHWLLIEKCPTGTVEIQAVCGGYEKGSTTLLVKAGMAKRETLRLRPLEASLVGGIYDAKTQQPIGGTVTYEGQASGSQSVAATPGTFAIGQARAGTYYLSAIGPTDDYLPQICTLEVPAGQTGKADFYLWKKGEALSLMVNFESGKATILPEFYAIIEQAATIIKQTPLIKKVELSGHTDSRFIKSKEFPSNWELSQARAEAIRQYMVGTVKVAPERIVARGYADTKPIASNATEEGRYKNRRTELKIIE